MFVSALAGTGVKAPSRYRKLQSYIHQPGSRPKSLFFLTATPINNSVHDFRRILELVTHEDDAYFSRDEKNIGIHSLRRYFVDLEKNLFAVRSIEPVGSINPGSQTSVPTKLWVGPQDQSELEAVAPGLELVVDYGLLTIIAKPVFTLMTWIFSLLGNWGWTIVALTFLIKAAFYPLSAASYRSMAKMKLVAPRLQALREKFGDDRQKLNTAMMEMYRTEKINPLGGCLPIVIQIPVFISLYYVLGSSVELRGAPWILWIEDLSVQDPYFILPLIMMATMFIQMKLNPTPPDPVQAKVMMFMPLVFGAMMFFFPSGLVLYWCVNNILSIAQQWYITQTIANQAAAAHR